jgi:hypothetical protein
MSNRINSSINLTKLGAEYRKGHSAFSTAKSGDIYVSLTEWINDTADQYGNNVSHQLNSKQDKREAEGKVYVGNGKTADIKQPVPEITGMRAQQPEEDGLPF